MDLNTRCIQRHKTFNMHYSLGQLPNERWGIYCDDKLLASIGCHQSGLQMLAQLQNKPGHFRSWEMLSTSTHIGKVWVGSTFSKLGVSPKQVIGK